MSIHLKMYFWNAAGKSNVTAYRCKRGFTRVILDSRRHEGSSRCYAVIERILLYVTRKYYFALNKWRCTYAPLPVPLSQVGGSSRTWFCEKTPWKRDYERATRLPVPRIFSSIKGFKIVRRVRGCASTRLASSKSESANVHGIWSNWN